MTKAVVANYAPDEALLRKLHLTYITDSLPFLAFIGPEDTSTNMHCDPGCAQNQVIALLDLGAQQPVQPVLYFQVHDCVPERLYCPDPLVV